MAIAPQPGIEQIALYEGGASHLEGINRVTKLSSNENPFGPSPAAKAAYQAAVESLERYPSTDHAELRDAIGEINGLDPARIICGAGSDEIIAFLCQSYTGPGDEVLYSAHGFLMYRISALAAGATPVEAPEIERRASVDALAAAITEKTRLVFLANPNNPTGTLLSAAEVEALADAVPETARLVLDGAYAEYVTEEDYDAGARLATERENVVMTRSFSKLYGLGGLRIGWGYGPKHVIDTLNRVRGPFNVSGPALVTAEAAMWDQSFVDQCREANMLWRDYLVDALRGLGIGCDQSHGNFVLARFADGDAAARANEWLKKGGLIVRGTGSYKLPEGLRITVGDEDACRSVIKYLREFIEADV